MTADAVVAGAGIVGAACAAELAREGLSVIVVDPREPGSGSTAAGMGHIVVMDDSEAEFALSNYSRKLWEQTDLPAQAERDDCGTLWIAADDEEMQAVHRKFDYYRRHGVETEVLDSRDLALLEPNLRRGLAGALRVPSDIVIYAPCATAHLLESSQARVLSGVGVTGFENGGVALSDGSRISAGATICACGVESAGLLPGLPVKPRKGQLAITDRYPGFLRHQLVELGYLKSAHGSDTESVAFNVQPRKTGQVLVGSSRRYGDHDPAIDLALLRRMLTRAVEYMPKLELLHVIRTWSGFRPATPDGLPLIGFDPRWPGVCLATGHEGLGITTAPGTARLVADAIMKRTPAIDPAPYSPCRFP
ncbi:MAG: FAD-dependent oxidoreductase [Bryobacteraceae bacterium]